MTRILLVLGFIGTFYLPFFAQGLPGWNTRQVVEIREQTGTTLTNYQVRIDLPYNASMNTDFSDIRFTLKDGSTLLDYWTEVVNPGVQATIWVELPSLAASATDSIFLYYNNSAALSASNGTNTFIFYDDFSTVSGWDSVGGGSVVGDNTTFSGENVLRKQGNCDPAGGWKGLGTTVTNFRLISRENRLGTFIDCPWNRYGLEDANFNGYSIRRNADSTGNQELGVEQRTNGISSNASDSTFPQTRGTWYRTELVRDCATQALEAYLFDDLKNLIGSEITTSSTYCSFDRVVVRGGRDYYVDVVAVANYVSQEPNINLSPTPIILPTNNLTFEVKQINGYAELSWTLNDALDIRSFDLEYSTEGVDFERFAEVGLQGLEYTYFDPTMRNGAVAYYRLRLWHRDGSDTYSDLKAISLPQKDLILEVLPNPVHQELMARIRSPHEEEAVLELRSITGQVVWSQVQPLKEGINELTLSMQDLPAGWYSFHVCTGSIERVRRIIKQ